MRIGELARQSGVSVRALRYYEEQGLLESTRTAGGQREFENSAVDRVRFFQTLYAAGLSSRRIAELLPCIDTGGTTKEQQAMLQSEREALAHRIAELHEASARLDVLITASNARSLEAV
ncbi:MerR family transcriptional regulator [Arthrobacter crusticola]|uniref:MerR family transcriptional regulator n=1 Tax=Arthrobacter crusticola TaxID=2547960 RepID=A0A4V3AMV2_9MICC|nr:MerR family transcriptional regulator [Arthrobacter crusticola]TDK28224.1 MerR family transcriptional regulator [Arthrobacter crusticola]